MQDFLSTQTEQLQNPLTGNVSIRPKYSSVEDFITEQVSIIVANALRMYPPASVQADMEAIRAAEARIKSAARVEPMAAIAERGR